MLNAADDPSSTDQSSEKIRSEDRHTYATSMTYGDQNGERWHGTTSDVSLNGAFLKTDTLTDGIQVGDQGVVEMEMEKRESSYTVTIPCTVARVTPNGLGLSFEDC